ncbi:MAG TPA: aldo/keto reductase [Gaiella sp.]|jgi:aryl-alcohol dehydrogenase-like predicted oxidoreductase
MEQIRLGRTNVQVSVVGLGCGGHSRLGMAGGASAREAARVVRRAVELGITLIDTAMVYETEEAVGLGIEGSRDGLVLSTKTLLQRSLDRPDDLISADELVENLDGSLRRLGTDYVDLYHLHALTTAQIDHAVDVLLPELERQRELGKVRFLGVTEMFGEDTGHEMLRRVLPADHFDVVMIGFNVLNPSARKTVFPLTMARDVGTLIMFAVRRALSIPERAREVVGELAARSGVGTDALDADDPLAFLREAPGVGSVVEAAYRFARHEPGAHVVLTGTGDPAHLEENVRSIQAPPLPPDVLARLEEMFGEVDSVSGN